jgi:hypothetical protein
MTRSLKPHHRADILGSNFYRISSDIANVRTAIRIGEEAVADHDEMTQGFYGDLFPDLSVVQGVNPEILVRDVPRADLEVIAMHGLAANIARRERLILEQQSIALAGSWRTLMGQLNGRQVQVQNKPGERTMEVIKATRGHIGVESHVAGIVAMPDPAPNFHIYVIPSRATNRGNGTRGATCYDVEAINDGGRQLVDLRVID